MARYNHLPIYKKSYELFQEIFFAAMEFPREYKYTLGEKLQKETMDTVLWIYKANSNEDKTPYIENILERIQAIELILRLCQDIKILSLKKYTQIILLAENISCQAEGWKTFSKKSPPSL
jgi:hypothetical protein